MKILKESTVHFAQSKQHIRHLCQTVAMCCAILFASGSAAHAQNYNITSTLTELDEFISKKQDYDKLKEQQISCLWKEVDTASSLEEIYYVYSGLYGLYESYSYDAAHDCAIRMRELAEQMGDPTKRLHAILLTAYSDVSAGMFLEANETINSIDIAELNDAQKVFFYSTCAKLNLDMAGSILTEPYQSQYYLRSINYSERVIEMIGAEEPDALPHFTNIYRCQKNYRKSIEALNLFLTRKDDLDNRSLGVSAGGLGEFYLMLGDTASAISYLTYSAINDIKDATKETPALSHLAGIVYAQGDIDRAYLYANAAFEDANFYEARHRKIEAGSVLPIIDAARYVIIERQNKSLYIYSILVSVLILLFIISIFIIGKQIRQLHKARKVIQLQNNELQQSNWHLTFANKIKEEYIGYFFRLNHEYLDELEKFQRSVSKKIANRQYEELNAMLKKMDFRKERENRLQSFDNIALKIFPDFVEQFNTLFEEEDKFVMPARGTLTPELRIFILIRLGISESEEIARLLNYSVNTINTYKTKVKKRSKLPKDEFDKKVMEIESRYNKNN